MGTDISSWAEESYQLLSDLWIPLKVLVLGPGETSKSKFLLKRREIIESLKEASEGEDAVSTSEELFRLHPAPQIEYGYAELAHVDQADVVIALIVASPREQGGVYRELDIIAQFPKYRKKVIIFLPRQKNYLDRFQAGALQAYTEDQKVKMTWPTLMECQQLREMCISKVHEQRKQRMFNKFITRIHARGEQL